MSDAAVVYVHGLWMPGAEAMLLRRRLRRDRGYLWQGFHYDSVRMPMTHIVAALRDTIGAIDAPRVHLLGHSLGGIVIQRYLERYPLEKPGRVVFLGTPAAGSRTARRVGEWGWGRRALGRAIGEELLAERVRSWDLDRELGIIAGTLPLGFGRLLLKFGEDNDGTVALAETRLAGATGFLPVHVSHMGMLWSAQVARAIGSFLEHGCFGL